MPSVARTQGDPFLVCNLLDFFSIAGVDQELFHLLAATHDDLVGVRLQRHSGSRVDEAAQCANARRIAVGEGQPGQLEIVSGADDRHGVRLVH